MYSMKVLTDLAIAAFMCIYFVNYFRSDSHIHCLRAICISAASHFPHNTLYHCLFSLVHQHSHTVTKERPSPHRSAFHINLLPITLRLRSICLQAQPRTRLSKPSAALFSHLCRISACSCHARRGHHRHYQLRFEIQILVPVIENINQL